jgi:hypothetical protein
MTLGASDLQHVILITILAVAIVTCILPWLLPSPPQPGERAPTFVRPSGVLVSLGMLALFGFLAGPPLIRFVAEVANLSLALGLVSVFCLFIAARAHLVLPTK